MAEPQRGQNACRRRLPLSAVVLRYVAGWPVMRKVAPETGTLTRKAEPVPAWQSVQWQTVVFSGSASPSILMYPQWHAPSIFMGSFLFPGQCAYHKPKIADREREATDIIGDIVARA